MLAFTDSRSGIDRQARDRLCTIKMSMRCYELHIGLRHLVYNAWRDDVENLKGRARRTLEVIG